jgi:putative transposase
MGSTFSPLNSSNEFMGWKETCAVEERFKFLQEHQSEEFGFAELCRRYGVSRKTGYKWVDRYEAEGLDGLRDQSRAPRHQPNEVLDDVANELIAARQKHPHWGPAKLRARLQRECPDIVWPATSTIGEILRRAGLTAPHRKRRKATPSQSPLSHAGAANQVWCADFKGWFQCADGSRCDPLTITDGYSRYLLRCQAVPAMDEASVRSVMEAAFREYGIPVSMRTDNGEPFASVGLAGLSKLSVWWLKLGIQPERIPPGKPQHNGRHERMHRTLKQATARPPAANLRKQQVAFDNFREEYNCQRPHEALDLQTPAEFYEPSCRSYPSRLLEPEYPDDWEVRGVRECGRMRWWSSNIFVGKLFGGERIGMEPVEDGWWKLWFFQTPLGLLDERNKVVRKLKPTGRRCPTLERSEPGLGGVR